MLQHTDPRDCAVWSDNDQYWTSCDWLSWCWVLLHLILGNWFISRVAFGLALTRHERWPIIVGEKAPLEPPQRHTVDLVVLKLGFGYWTFELIWQQCSRGKSLGNKHNGSKLGCCAGRKNLIKRIFYECVAFHPSREVVQGNSYVHNAPVPSKSSTKVLVSGRVSIVRYQN